MIEPLRLSFLAACEAEHAFAVWTSLTTRWWPVGHTVSSESGLSVVFEPRVGGRIYERPPSGNEVDWGEILRWEPPRRLTYLWHINADRSDATEVEIAFNSEGEHSTRVEIEHRGWERLGARGQPRRDANERGWSGLLPAFVGACASPDLRARAAVQTAEPG